MYEGKSHTLFAKYAVPQMIGLLFNSVYMIVDGVFIAPSIYDDVLRNRERERLTQRGFADLKTQELSVYIPTLKNGGLLRNILPCQRGHLGRRKALIYATCRERKQNK